MLTFTDYSPDQAGLSYWLLPEKLRYTCAYFPKGKSTKKAFTLAEAYENGGSFAFFREGTSGSGFQDFRQKAENAVSTTADRAFLWIDDRESEWEYSEITETGKQMDADLIFDMGGYDFSLYFSGKSVQTGLEGEQILFSASLNAQLYPPGEENAVSIKISGIDFSGIKLAGSLLLNIPYVSREQQEKSFWQIFRLQMRYVYTSDATLQKAQCFTLLPLAESGDSFSLNGQIHPFRPLDGEATFLKPEKYSKTLLESNFSFADGSPVCFKTSDLAIGFEKTVDLDSGQDQFYFSLKGKAMAASRLEGEGRNTFLHDDCSPNELSLLLSPDGGQSLSLREKDLYFYFVDKPSYATVQTDQNNGLAIMDDRCTVPWIAVRQSGETPPEYYRHPAGFCSYDTKQESPVYEGYPEWELMASDVEEDALPLLPNRIAVSGEDREEGSVSLLESAVLSPLRSQVLKQSGIAPQLRGRRYRSGNLCVNGGYAYEQSVNGQSGNEEEGCKTKGNEAQARKYKGNEAQARKYKGDEEQERETEELVWLGFGDEDGITEPGEIPLMAFSHVRGDLKSAFLEGETFLVMAEEEPVKECCSLVYRMTEKLMAQIQSGGMIASRAREDLKTYFDNNKSLYGRQFADEASFEDILVKASQNLTDEEICRIEKICAGFYFKEGDFLFSLAPGYWKDNGTVLIFKFCRGITLEELALDVSRWSFPAAAGDSLLTKQKILRAIDNARMDQRSGEDTGHESEYAGLLKVCEDPDFTGILALNCPCINSDIPPCLSEYADTFSITDLRAPYAVIRCSHAQKTEEDKIRFFTGTQTMLSCESLVKGDTPQDGFSFALEELFLLLENGQITGKHIHASLYLDTLFASSLSLPGGGNTINLCGTGQKQGGVFRYELESYTEAEYFLAKSPLDSVEIRQISLAVSGTGDETRAVCTLSGRIRFRYQDGFDVYSYGRDGRDDSFLSFLGLVFTVRTNKKSGERTVSKDTGGIRIAESGKSPRNGSFAKCFPVVLKRFLCYDDNPAGTLPKDLLYTGIQAPVEQGELSKVWYGMVWETDLGACGLSPLKGVRMQLLTAWGPADAGEEAAELFAGTSEYMGIRLLAPDGKAFSMEFTLFDAFKMKFKAVELKYGESADGRKKYWFLFRNFVLQLFALSLPNGSNTLGIYPDPDEGGASGKLGWYCVYSK